jgi:kanamycin nucleotidyltransferase
MTLDATAATERRLAVARSLLPELAAALNDDLVAVAVYGSVAHGQARKYSDLEVVVLTTDAVPSVERQEVRDGILVEVDTLPASRMLAAAGRVGPLWGVEADQYRTFRPLYDPTAVLAAVRGRSLSIASERFQPALDANCLRLLEVRGKFKNALAIGDASTMRDVGWRYAHAAAMRIALLERQPYESGRTLWADASRRGYKMSALVENLTDGPVAEQPGVMAAVWDAVLRDQANHPPF